MTVNLVFHKLYLLCCLLIFASVAWGQSDTGTPNEEVMIPPNSYESVNAGSLNILLSASVRSKGGPIPFHGTVSQNVQVYVPSGSSNYGTTAFLFSDQAAIGYWQGNVPLSHAGSSSCAGGTTHIEQVLGIADEHGTFHSLPPNTFWDSQGCLYGDIDVYTTDNSGFEVVITKGNGTPNAVEAHTTVYSKNGTASNMHGVDGGAVTDTHGNQLVLTVASGVYTFTDELTSTPVLTYNSTTSASTTYSSTDGTGATRNVVATWPNQSYLPAFSCAGLSNGTLSGISPLSSVAYPDGSTVQFTYEKTAANNLNGRLKTVVVPTGGIFTHNYSGGTNGDGLWCETDRVSNATMTISNGTGTWTFARVIGTGTYPNRIITTTVTKPDGSKIVYTFKGDQSPILTSKVVYDTNGTTELDRMTYCYDSTFSSCNPQAFMAQNPTWVRVYHTVPGVTGNAEVDTKFDTYGNVVEVDRFDYGPTLVNKSYVTYGTWGGSSCSAIGGHIVGKPCYAHAQDASANDLNTSLFYYNSAGDLLQAQAYTGSAYLSSFNTYNANGTTATSTGADGVGTTYSYTGTGGCNSLLATSSTTAVGTTSTTWDCNGAVPLTSTNLNGLTVTTTYGDPLYRVTQASDNGGQAPVLYTYPSATRTSRHMTFNSGASISDTTTTVNALGQVISVQHQTAPGSSNYDTASLTYDSTGHRTGISTACTTTIGATCPTTAVAFTYDGLGRPKSKTVKTATNGVLTFTYPNGDVKTVLTPAPTGENSKIVQVERDGLGRTTRVCAVVTSGLSGTGSCGQRASGTGYLTKYTLDALGRATQISRNAQAGATPVNSTATYDWLSRVTQASTPESGTTNSYFDTAHGPCAAPLAGHLNEVVDAAGNATCFYYEVMGRLSAMAFPSGPNAVNSQQKNFFYDGSATKAGHLSQATTCTGACSVVITSELFDYDLYGRLSYVAQNSPGLGAGLYFQTSASYFDNGSLKTLTGLPGISNFTYTLDAEGRPYGATSGATGIVSSVTYDSASNPLTITYASGDKDGYQWDAFSQNTTQYQFTVGAANTTDTGVPTWNPNGTLKQLQITDNLTSSDTQTCTTGHDDLVRITSWNCGALANGTYSYSPDYAGNVTKGGTFLFSPGYAASNNRMLAPFTYDANGNMIHDGTLAVDYNWDSAGSVASVTGTAITNDASGTMVEKLSGSTHTYVLYSPIGKLGTTSSLTAPLSLRIPLPGGPSITYDNAGNQRINHKDFVGSTRLITNRAARTLVGVFCYGPMGEIYCGTAASSQYEGNAQDTTPGLFDYGSDRYSGTQGRSISPTGGANGYVKTNSPF